MSLKICPGGIREANTIVYIYMYIYIYIFKYCFCRPVARGCRKRPLPSERIEAMGRKPWGRNQRIEANWGGNRWDRNPGVPQRNGGPPRLSDDAGDGDRWRRSVAPMPLGRCGRGWVWRHTVSFNLEDSFIYSTTAATAATTAASFIPQPLLLLSSLPRPKS